MKVKVRFRRSFSKFYPIFVKKFKHLNICWKVDPDQKLWAFIVLRQGIISGQGLWPATYRIVKNLNSRKKKKKSSKDLHQT